jgi:hypothetical protein
MVCAPADKQKTVANKKAPVPSFAMSADFDWLELAGRDAISEGVS